MKQIVGDVATLPMDAAFAELAARSFASAEAREGMAARAEKRLPRWTVDS